MGRPLADVILPGHGHVVRGYLPWHDDVPTLSHDVFHIVSEGRIEGEPDGACLRKLIFSDSQCSGVRLSMEWQT